MTGPKPKSRAKAPSVKRRKPAAERVEETVKVLVTADERTELDAAAKRDGRTLSAWARRVLVAAAKASPDGGDRP